MKFKDFEYTRIDMDLLKKDFTDYLKEFKTATSFDKQDSIMTEINNLRNNFESMMNIAIARHEIDIMDHFYEKENDYYDEVSPLYEGLVSDYYRELIASEFRSDLEVKWGKQLFRLAEMRIRTFSGAIVEDLQMENKLSSRYDNLKAGAQIHFDGEIRTLAQMAPFTSSKDRNTRIRASEAVSEFYSNNEEQFDSIYHELVQVRNLIAGKLGFKNFIELGYARLGRSDYNAEDTANYRNQVFEEVVPLALKLRKRQAVRLKLDSLKYYDESLEYLTGNAFPKGDPQWIIEKGKLMYSELSPETDEFFRFMSENEMMDLEAKKGKASGGYCEYIANYKSPFIFSNFNGTSDDIDVLTHEAGHAFQIFSCRDLEIPEYSCPTYEACEIHSMSMEFFAWPWMESFFREDTEKYKFSHLSNALLFIPYGVTVDEFQHWVYENPAATPELRKKAWRDIERKYLPHRDYEDNEFLERGGFWFRQGHIFVDPFYYIDYTLAQISAFEFWNKAENNKEKAWNDYLTLCKAGGSLSFLELLKLADLNNPFASGTLGKTIKAVSLWLDKVDDRLL